MSQVLMPGMGVEKAKRPARYFFQRTGLGQEKGKIILRGISYEIQIQAVIHVSGGQNQRSQERC
jgi:hypothetical protein